MAKELKKVLTLGDAVFLIVGNVIGVGIFTTTGIVAKYAGSALETMIAWALGGILSLLGAMTYSELASMFPLAGGDYVYIREAYGRMPAFLLGWVDLLIINSGSIAALALGLSEYTELSSNLSKKLFAGSVIASLSFLNILGVKKGSKLQNILSYGILAFLAGFSILGLLSGNGSWESFKSVPALSSYDLIHILGPAMMPVLFTYSGWFASAYVAQEVKKPEVNVPKSLILGSIIVTCLYLAVNITYLYAIPFKKLAGIVNVGEISMATLFGREASNAASIFIVFAILSSINSTIITSPRIYYAMARDGVFIKDVGRIHNRYNTPHVAITLQMVISLALIAWGSFNRLLIYVTFIMILSSIFSSLAVFILRSKEAKRKREYRVPLYPYSVILFLASYTLVAAGVLIKSPEESILGLFITLTGVPFYLFWKKGKEEEVHEV